MAWGTRQIEIFNRDGTKTTETFPVEYDDVRDQVITQYRQATLALRDATGVPVVVKQWVAALNDVLRYLNSEIKE